eukprot:3057236-Amphidinium_carterae.1
MHPVPCQCPYSHNARPGAWPTSDEFEANSAMGAVANALTGHAVSQMQYLTHALMLLGPHCHSARCFCGHRYYEMVEWSCTSQQKIIAFSCCSQMLFGPGAFSNFCFSLRVS